MSFDPFDGADHQLIIGESCKTLLGPKHKSDVKYTSVKYDYKPHRIDYDKQGILDTSDASKCYIHLPLVEEASSSRASSTFKGNRQDLQSNGVSKECILVIDREAGTITLEHVTSKIDVKQTREQEAKETHFKPRPARKSKSESSSSSHHHEPPRKTSRLPEVKEKDLSNRSMPTSKKDRNMPEIIGMESESNNSQIFGSNIGSILSSESDSNQEDSSSSSSTSSDNESDDSNQQEDGSKPVKPEPLPPPQSTDMADFGLDLSSESSSDSDSS